MLSKISQAWRNLTVRKGATAERDEKSEVLAGDRLLSLASLFVAHLRLIDSDPESKRINDLVQRNGVKFMPLVQLRRFIELEESIEQASRSERVVPEGAVRSPFDEAMSVVASRCIKINNMLADVTPRAEVLRTAANYAASVGHPYRGPALDTQLVRNLMEEVSQHRVRDELLDCASHLAAAQPS